MGGACSLAARGRCAAAAEEEEEEGRGKKGRERNAAGMREGHRHHEPPPSGTPQPPLGSGFGLLDSNQDAVCIQRTGRVSTICHKIECGLSQESSICGSSSQGIEASSKCTLLREKPGTCLLPIFDDGVLCPTCLEGYNDENPKIIARCKHHFHLSCILEWKERSDKCPICDKIMDFNEV